MAALRGLEAAVPCASADKPSLANDRELLITKFSVSITAASSPATAHASSADESMLAALITDGSTKAPKMSLDEPPCGCVAPLRPLLVALLVWLALLLLQRLLLVAVRLRLRLRWWRCALPRVLV